MLAISTPGMLSAADRTRSSSAASRADSTCDVASVDTACSIPDAAPAHPTSLVGSMLTVPAKGGCAVASSRQRRGQPYAVAGSTGYDLSGGRSRAATGVDASA